MDAVKHKKDNGYFTVEATFIVVSMLLIIFAVIYGFMLIYQYAVLYNAASLGANEAVIQYENDKTAGAIISSAKSVSQEETKRGFLNSNGCTVDVKIESSGLFGHKVVVIVKQRLLPSIRQIIPFFDSEKLCITARVENKLSGTKSAQGMINGVDFAFEVVNRFVATGKNIFNSVLPFLIME